MLYDVLKISSITATQYLYDIYKRFDVKFLKIYEVIYIIKFKNTFFKSSMKCF